MQNNTGKPARAAYSTPELRTYGDVSTLTRTNRSNPASSVDRGHTQNRTA